MTEPSPLTGHLPVSIEFFPPKTPEGVEKLKTVRQQLYPLKPHFFSCTYGAGGSTQDGTLQTVNAIIQDGFDAAPHFSCIGSTRESVRAQLDSFKASGIKRMVALRGDLPSGYGGFGEFKYASELIEFIRNGLLGGTWSKEKEFPPGDPSRWRQQGRLRDRPVSPRPPSPPRS